MKNWAISLIIMFSLQSVALAESCPSFQASTMKVDGVPAAKWREDYPVIFPDPDDVQPWERIDFRSTPIDYMQKVLESAKPHFRNDNGKLVGTGSEPWWISKWLDYERSGREPLMGLTKERGPKAGDLSRTSTEGSQVWAVGFYNVPGAAVLGEIFADPCAPSLPANLKFPNDTVSVKFLFTDAADTQVTYLAGAPTYTARIDKPGSGSKSLPVEDRAPQQLKLLQVDLAVSGAPRAPSRRRSEGRCWKPEGFDT